MRIGRAERSLIVREDAFVERAGLGELAETGENRSDRVPAVDGGTVIRAEEIVERSRRLAGRCDRLGVPACLI